MKIVRLGPSPVRGERELLYQMKKPFVFSTELVFSILLSAVLLLSARIPELRIFLAPLILVGIGDLVLSRLCGKEKLSSYALRAQQPAHRETDVYALRFEHLDFFRVPIEAIKIGDEILCEAGKSIPADGIVLQGMALVDESTITGESAPVIRDSEGERRFVTEGTRVLSNRLLIRIVKPPKFGFSAQYHKQVDFDSVRTPVVERYLRYSALLITVILFLLALGLQAYRSLNLDSQSIKILCGLVVIAICIAPLWSLIRLQKFLNIAFIDQLLHRHLIPMNPDSFDRAGQIDTVVVSGNTGATAESTIEVSHLFPAPDIDVEDLARAAQLAALGGESEQSRAVGAFVKTKFGFLSQAITNKQVHFISELGVGRLCGVNIFSDEGEDGMRSILIGSLELVRHHVESLGGYVPSSVSLKNSEIKQAGDDATVVCDGRKILGIIHFIIRNTDKASEEIIALERIGLRMVALQSGEKPNMTSSTIAAARLAVVQCLQGQGHKVAMVGSQVEDKPALAQADLSLVTNYRNDELLELSDVTNVSGDRLRFKYLFVLGRELKRRRHQLTSLGLACIASVVVTVIPFMTVASQASFVKGAWQIHSAKMTSYAIALSSACLSLVICTFLMSYAIAGLHERRGKLFLIARVVFNSPAYVFQMFFFSALMTGMFDLLMEFLRQTYS